MAYTPTTFVDNDFPAINASELNKIGSGIQNAQSTADAALAAGGGGGGVFPATVLLDSFTGATDDDKLDAAFSYVQGRPGGITPTIMLVGRTYTFTRSHTTFNGLRISGSPFTGWNSLEIGSGNLAPTKVIFNGGINGSSFLVGTGTNFYGYVGHLAFQSSNNNSQFFHHPLASGSAYCWTFDTLSFMGFKHVMGNPTNPMAITACNIKGEWTVLANASGSDVQFTLGGSDSDLWIDGTCNLGPSDTGAGGGKYLMILNSMGKTNVGGVFFTADAGWRALLVQGSTSYGPGLNCHGMRIEGRNPTDPSYGALVKVTSGAVMFRDCWISYGMSNPGAYTDATDTAIVMVTGGDAIFDGVVYDRASSVGESTPLFRTSGSGVLEVEHVRTCTRGGSWSGKPQVTGSNITADASVTVV